MHTNGAANLVFFHCKQSSILHHISESRGRSHEFKAIFKEMKVVETVLFENGEALVQSRVRKVLELIGVRNLYPMDIIKHHILPQLTTGTWKVSA